MKDKFLNIKANFNFSNKDDMYNFYNYFHVLRYTPVNSLFTDNDIVLEFNVPYKSLHKFINNINELVEEYDYYNNNSKIICDIYVPEGLWV